MHDLELKRVLIDLTKKLDPWAITAGAVTGMTHDYKFFRGTAPTTGAFVSSFSTATYPYLELSTATDTLSLVSDDAADAAAGTGARTVTIVGLDSDWLPYENTYTMTGVTPVIIPAGTFKRVHRMFVATAGTYAVGGNTGHNVGDITLKMTTTPFGTVAEIKPEVGGTLMCNYTVAAGHTMYMTRVGVYVEDSKIVDVELWKREQADVIAAPFGPTRVRLTLDAIQTERTAEFTGALKFTEKTDIWLYGSASTGTAEIDGYFDIFLANNETFVLPK